MILLLALTIFIIRITKGKYQEFGLKVSLLPFLAALFDVVENIFLLIMLFNYDKPVFFLFPLIASTCAVIKFGLIIGCLVYFLGGIIVKMLYFFQIIE